MSPEQHAEQVAQPVGQPDAQRNAAFQQAANADPEAESASKFSLTAMTNGWKWGHMLLCGLTAALAIVGMGFSAKAVAQGWHSDGYDDTVDYYYYDDDNYGNNVLAAISIPVYVLAVIIVLAEVAVRFALKGHKGLHPAVHIGTWLICFLFFVGISIFVGLMVSARAYVEYTSGSDVYVELVFSIILAVCSLIIFILACIETQSYNVNASTAPTTDANGNIISNFHEDRSWRVTKLVLNAMAIIFGVLGFAIGLSLIDAHPDFLGYSVIFPACAATLLLPIVWALVDLCYSVTGTRRKYFQGMHPGAHVGVWLISWIILSIVSGGITAFAIIRSSECADLQYERRSLDVSHNMMSVPVVGSTIVPNKVRDLNGPPSATTLSITASASSTSTSIFGSRPTSSSSSTLPKSTSYPYGDDPYYPYGDDPDSDDPYGDDPYTGSSGSGSSGSGSSGRGSSGSGSSGSGSSSNSPYSSDPYGSDPYSSDPYGSDPYSSDPYHNGGYRNGYPNSDDEEKEESCEDKGVSSRMIVTSIFMWIVVVISFVQFVAGCSDTYLRNRRNPVQVIYVPTPQPMAPAAMQYGNVPFPSNGKQPMTQVPGPAPGAPAPGAPVAQQTQAEQQSRVVEYYGTAQ